MIYEKEAHMNMGIYDTLEEAQEIVDAWAKEDGEENYAIREVEE